MSMIQSDLLLGQEGGASYTIARSLRFSSNDSTFCARTPSSAGNRKTFTFAAWVKRARVPNIYNESYFFSCIFSPNNSDSNYFRFGFAGDRLFCGLYGTGVSSAAVYRDYSAWYHVVLAVDTTQATASNRIRLYVNGSEITAFNSASYPAQNTDLAVNSTNAHHLGYTPDPTYGHDGYLADVHLIDGQQLTPSSFTEVSATTGQLVPKQYTGSFGTNGFWLKFSDNSAATATTLGKDYSGNNNNWSPSNLSVTAGAGNDSLTDTPTSYGTDTGAGGEVRGNYATLNPLDIGNNTSISNGNLDVTLGASSGGWRTTKTTISVSSGKWYVEATAGTLFSSLSAGVGAVNVTRDAKNTYTSFFSDGYMYNCNGQIGNNNSTIRTESSWTTNDVIGVALDVDNSTIRFYKNGVAQGAAITVASSISYAFTVGGVNTSNTLFCNFGQRPFAYTAPSGFKALCDTNLPAPVVAKPSSAFDVKLYTGNGTTNSITGLGFSPDLVWIKARSVGYWHRLIDSVRGAQKFLYSNATDAEGTSTANDIFTSFDSTGFTLGGADPSGDGLNQNTLPYVAWTWDAGSSTTTNNSGSISSQVRANASAGFSIVTAPVASSASGPTIGHGLGVTPGLIIAKNRTSAIPWYVWHSSFSANQKLLLNSTSAVATDTNTWGSITSSTLQMGATGTAVNVAWVSSGTENFVFYCFAPVAGYSSFGSYVGNGSSDGVFVYTGHRPRWILLKATSIANESWIIIDTARSTYNVVDAFLRADTSGAEFSSSLRYVDILSNGFKLRASGTEVNGSGTTYVYASFAESPFAYSRAR